MYTFQCEGFQMGQSNAVLLKEVAAFQRCPLKGINFHHVSSHVYTMTYGLC